MAAVIARVGKISGEAFARNATGELRRIKNGDPIREGEVVQVGTGGEVQLKLMDGRDLIVRPNEAAKLDAEVAAAERPDSGDSAVQNSAAGFVKISKAIVGFDGTFSFEDDGGRVANPGAQNEGHGFVEFARIVELVDPLAFQFSTARGQPLEEIRGGGVRSEAATVFTFAPPETESISLLGSEDSPIRIDLKGSDQDGVVVGYVIRSLPANGLLYADAALTQLVSVEQIVTGQLFFKPNNNWNGTTSFQYASVDNTGSVDETPATVTIDIAPVNDLVSLTVPDTNGGVTGNVSVAENATLTGQTFTISAPDGLDPNAALTIAGTPVSQAALENSATSNVTINTPEGVLTITGYDPVTGVVTYNYDPSGSSKNHTGGEVLDTISILVKDDNGDTQPGNLVINILDTAPVARPDSNAVTEDTAPNPVAGNVITTGGGADTLGADATAVTGIVAGTGTPGNNVAAGTTSVNGTSVNGAYGTLVLGADGSYSYRLDNTNATVNALKTGDSLTETFTYTITDADGDPSTTTLTITINGTTDGGPSIVPVDGNAGATGQASVHEHGLTSGADTSETTTGTISVGSPDGLASVKIGGATLTVAQLQALSAGSPQVIDTGEGWLTLTGFNGTGSAPLGGDISYTYTLKAALTQPGASESSDLIPLEVTDRGGITSSGTLTVQIVDDTPVARPDSNAVSEGTTSADSTVSGNVFSGTAPDAADDLGADTRSNPVTAISFGGTPQTIGSEFTTTYGHLTLNADGSYSYRLDNTNAAVNALKTGDSLTETFTYTITDADGDPSTTTLTITINGTTDGGPSIVPVDGNAGATGQASVHEHGLTSGADTSETTTGTISVGSPDGLASVKIGGATLTVAQLQALSVGSPQVIDTGEGWLTLTGFNGTGSAPLGGDISYTYTLKAALTQPGASESSDLIPLEVTDRGGITSSGTLTVQIVDDTPVAHPDSNAVTEDTAPNPVAGNVITTGGGADTLGADATAVTGIVAGTGTPGNNVAAGTTSVNGTSVNGAYGTLVLGADGSYSYTLDNARPAVQALNAGQTATETFTYTITDADGDPSTTTLTLTIHGSDDGVALTVPDTNGGVTGNVSVAENATLTGQTFTISAPDGLDPNAALTIAGTPVSQAALENSATSNVTINTPEGVLTITGYDPVTGVVTYNYDPSGSSKNHTGGEVLDTISILVKDDNGDTQPGNLVINILDTAPVARPDSNAVTEDTAPNPVAGNVITTGGGADTLGADATAVTGIVAGTGTPGNNVAAGTTSANGTSVNGAYGTLVLGADGSYSYRLDNTNAAVNALKTGDSLTETFTYTITDADGDPSTTTLTITINGITDGGPSIVPVDGNAGATGQASVHEHGLTSGADTSETTTGTISVGSPDGLASVKIGGATLTVAQLQALSAGSPQVIDTGEGTLTLTGFSGTGVAPLNGVISYTYTLKAALNQPGASESSDLIALEVTDRGGITTSGTLTVQIVDDTPTANPDNNSVSEGTTSADSTVSGNVFSGAAPDAADRLGADSVANPVTAVSFGGAPQTVGSEFATTYGHLTLNADGSYSYRLDNTNAAVNALKTGETLNETFTYTITDADGDPSTTTLSITINGTTDGGPSIVPVDGNAGATGQASVLERGLTSVGDTSETTAGTIDVGSPDGLTSVKVGGVTLTVAQLQALSVGSPQVIDTGEGTLTLTGFSGTGVAPLNGVISYTYTLKAALNQPGASESSDLIALEVTDRGGITTSGTLTVQIVNDTPTANPDNNDITEDAVPNAVSGNVMTTGAGQDVLSADATRVTGAMVGIGTPGGNVAAGTTSLTGTTVAGVYGSVKIGADGSYSYTLDNTKASVQALNAGQSTTETFTYTITDADGDSSTTTLTITIHGTDDGVAITVPDTNAGATGNASVLENASLAAQTFAISAPDGLDPTAALTIAGTVVSKAALENSAVTNVTINTPEGVLTLTGYNPATGVVSYSYDPNGTRKDHTSGEVLDTISIVVRDDNGDTQPGSLVINIVDTAPLARPDTNAVTEDAVPNPVAGNVITTGGGADTLGADATVVTGIMAGSGTPGNNVASGTTSLNGTSVNGTYGTLVLGADGSYSYTLDNSRPAVQALARNQAVSETYTYTITDSDGDPSTTTLAITVTGANDAPIITVRAGDADSASLTETNSRLFVSDTLSVFDIDTQDTVTASKVDSLAVGGSYSGARPSDAVLKAMFSVTGGESSTAAQDAPNGITWTFDSRSEAFNAIPAGQTLILTYTVRATDNQGASVDQPITITITGTNDAPVAVANTAAVIEDAADQSGYNDSNSGTTIVGGNVLTNDTDVDTGDTRSVTGVAAGTPASASGNVATSVAGTYGNVSIAADGSYTYTLGNTKPGVQALASGQNVTDTFSYTITDSQGATSTTTLTVTVSGANDRPDITVGTGDTASVTLVETNSALTTSGRLSIFDIDTTNTVTAAKLSVGVNSASTYTGPQPDNAQLLAMFTVAGGNVLNNTQQSNPNGISWAFNSGSQNFDFLPAGQTLVLDYVVRARDSSGASNRDDTQVVQITITGTNDAGTIVADTISGPETGTITGNVLSNDLPDPDNNEVLSVSAVTLDTNGDGSQDSYVLGTTINITSASGGILGSFVMNSSGAYTFTPRDANYSGAVPVITYTAGNATFSDSKTLTITVNPVSDAPGVTVDAANTSTPEDTHVALGFNAPTVSDAIDQNGPGVSGDNPERLGLITLDGIPAGAQLLDGTNSNALLHLAAGGAITILLSDATNLISSPGAATLTMTTAQFEALRLLPAANSGSNLSVSMSVTSFEVDNAGNQISGVAGAVSTTSVNIDVLAVTDPVDLKINGTDGPYDATIQEDGALDLKALLTATFNDVLDGSEVRYIDLAGLPQGSVVNGVVVGAAGTASIQLVGNNTLPAISLIPPANFSGDINGITVTLRANDTDADSTVTTLNETDSVTLNLHVNPVAGDVTVSNVSTPEDTAVKFLQGLALTDTDGSESITGIVVKNVPTGWVLKDNAGTVVLTGNGVDTYTVPVGGDFRNYTLTPPAHSSANATISLDLTTTDTQTVNGASVTNTQTVTRSETITVNAVAEVVGGDSNGDTLPDLTMTPGFHYTSQGAEDQWFSLKSDGFNLMAGWANQDADGSEQTFALLSPVLSGGSAIGSQFRYTDGSGVHVLTYNGTAVEIPMAYLDTVQFMAAPNVAGAFTIGVQARTVDTDPDTGASVSALSGSATLTNLFIAPVADAVTLAVTGAVTGNEDSLIPLRIKPTSADPSETFNVTISGIPAGSVLLYDGTPVSVAGNSATIANFDTTKSLAIQPPANSNTDFSLNVSAVSVDTVGGFTSTSLPTVLSIAVDVRGVADSAAITTTSLPFVTTEAVVDSGAKRIALSSIITSAALTDSDGSETLSFVLSGLPAGFSVEGLTFTGGTGAARVWAGTATEFASAKIVLLDDNYSGSFDFKFRAITTENDGNSLTGNWVTVPVQVTPSPEATINAMTTASEDTLTRVDFALQIQNGDSNETLSSVWINAADLAGKPFTLYLGATPLTAALPNDGGWYKLSGADIGNVFVKGSANSDADGSFGVRYAITDPSNDGTLPAVTQQFDTNYGITIIPVTDATTSSNDFASRVIASTEVVTVNVTVTQNDDPNAGNAKDIDGSEKLLHFIVDGVPLGVTVVGGNYIGNTPGNPNTGRWILDIPDAPFSGPSLTQAIQFSLDGTAGQLSGLNQAISITAHTQDTGASAATTSTTSWTLQTAPSFNDTSPQPTTPAATIATWAKDSMLLSMTEDVPVSLNTLLDASISGTSPFAVTLTGLPAGTVVTGMMMTMVGGVPVWSAQGAGDNSALQALLNSITVTPPANANSNSGPFAFSTTLTTYDDGGGRHDSSLAVSMPVTPVSDPIVLTASDSNANEDSPASISIALSNVADGTNTNVVGGKVYVRLDESGMEASGGVLRFNGNPVSATAVSGVPGIADGTYFVLNGVSNGATLNLTYEPVANASGTVGYTAYVQNQETGAANVVTSSTSGNFDIAKVNDGVVLTAHNVVNGLEDQAVPLAISATLVDAGERIQSITLSHVPDGFQVYYGNGAPGTAAINMGGGVWSIPASAGSVPAYIALLPPPNWSGVVSGITAEVWSGETGLDQTVNSANFDVTFNGVADGILISPTLSFGNEGQIAPFNLNSAMPDMDGSETAIITVKGLGNFAAFYAGGTLLSASYDGGSDTYTLSGLTPAEVSGLGVIQKDGAFDLTITAQTMDSPGGNLSAVVTANLHLDINPVVATTGDDRLLYDGGALNGLTGVDTIEFRLGENLDFSASPVKPTNIERFDLMPAGQNHSLGHLSVQDVLDMTGSGKSLTVLGDNGDSVSLKNTVGGTWSAGPSQTVDGHLFDVYLNTQDPAVRVLIEQQINKSIDP